MTKQWVILELDDVEAAIIRLILLETRINLDTERMLETQPERWQAIGREIEIDVLDRLIAKFPTNAT